MDFKSQRRQMAKEQIAARGIRSKAVLRAILKVERHKFVPAESQESAYSDFPLSIGEGQTISQPYMVALMSEQLKLSGKEKVLEVGTGSGYQTAILAELAKEVFSIERIESLAIRAKELLDSLGYTNIFTKVGNGSLGWQENAPYERIMVTAAGAKVPDPLFEQLKEGGLLLMPVGEDRVSQVLTLVKKEGGKPKSSPICGCVFVPLV